jgi:hypothetical protein
VDVVRHGGANGIAYRRGVVYVANTELGQIGTCRASWIGAAP